MRDIRLPRLISSRRAPGLPIRTRPSLAGIRRASGQALVEYALILALLALAFGVTLAATGPALGNIFQNVVYNMVGGRNPEDITPASNYGSASNFWATVTWVYSNPQQETPFPP